MKTRGLLFAPLLGLLACTHPDPGTPPQLLVQLTPDVLPVVNEPPDVALPDFVGDVGAAPVILGAGDVVAISVIEPAGGGLYTPLGASGPGRITNLPAATLDAAGAVTLPFAGKVAIAGLPPDAAAVKLQKSLARLAISPQVKLSLISSATRHIMVEGAVARPGPQQIPAGGLLLQDAIARAGGASADAYDIMVELDRAGTRNPIRFEDLIGQPIYNVNLRESDTLRLSVVPHRIALMGAVAQQDTALPEAGESLGQIAASVPHAKRAYLLRLEPRGTALRISAIMAKQERQAGTDTMGNVLAGRQPVGPSIKLPDTDSPVPVVFAFDPSDPSQALLAAQIGLRDDDVVYVPAGGQDGPKFFGLAR